MLFHIEKDIVLPESEMYWVEENVAACETATELKMKR